MKVIPKKNEKTKKNENLLVSSVIFVIISLKGSLTLKISQKSETKSFRCATQKLSSLFPLFVLL